MKPDIQHTVMASELREVGASTVAVPRVTILMAVYNAARYLDKAIQSVQHQSFTHWQLICVDDASTDDSYDLLQRYAEQDERITVLHKSVNEGQAIARNDALTLAKGEYVGMLDADDWLGEDCLSSVIQTFTLKTDTVILNLMEYYDNDSPSTRRYETPYTCQDVISGEEAFEASLDWRLHGLYFVRRDIHLKYPYDSSCRLFSDDNTTRLHYLHSREVRFCDGTYFYRKHAESCTNAITMDRFLYMDANYSMRQTLVREGVSEEILQFYEAHRWLNYIGQIWFFAQYRSRFTPKERKHIISRFRHFYDTFEGRPVPAKFGYTRFSHFPLFVIQEYIYFSVRLLLLRKSR